MEEVPIPDCKPYLVEPDPSCKDFIMQQTMLRIKDPKVSLKFYSEVLGMRLLKKFDYPSMKFSIYFMSYERPEDIPEDETEKLRFLNTRRGTIELTHNWGTETDPNFKGYCNGNSEGRGFGHIGISVPDLQGACKRFEEKGVKFIKKIDEGKMKNLAFICDPDGYWIEVLSPNTPIS